MRLQNALLCSLLAAFSMSVSAETLEIGALPAADSAVLYVAEAEGLFQQEGLDVKVIPFKSALEIGAAMRAGRLDGHFGDLMNVFTQNETGIAQKIVLTTTHTHPEQRAFGLLVSPKVTKYEKLEDLKGATTAMSSSTIIDYLLDRMKETAKLAPDAMKNLEVKQIPIRLQMLQSGQVETAMLPEPLVTVVEQKGGRVLWNDSQLDEALAIVALKAAYTDEKTVSAFRKAVAGAAKLMEEKPDTYRELMVKKGLLPPPVAKDYKMVRFSMFGTADGLPPLPTAEEVRRVGEWMVQKKMIKSVPAYEDVVAP